jgi:hypothetical protein
VFAYTTTRKVLIRDRYLGLTYIAAQIAILIYVVVYQIVLLQAYFEKGSIAGVTRMSLRRPTPEYRWNGDAPYCLGTNATSAPHYKVFLDSKYQYTNSKGFSLNQSQANCLYLDNRYALVSDSEVNAMFLPTRVSIIDEVVTPFAPCINLQQEFCEWTTVSSNLTYTADVSMFTLLIDHSFTSTVGASYNVRQMEGKLLAADGAEFDPCSVYSSYSSGCPTYITSGGSGTTSVFPMQALLQAGGLESLDEPASTIGSLALETRRYAGLVMIIDIQYTNFYLPGGGIKFGSNSFREDKVVFAYRVSVVPEQDYKSELVITADENKYAPTRTTYNQHGMRIIVTQSGRIGLFNFQALLINLTVSLGLLSVAMIITDFIAFSICPARSIYQQYRLRQSVDMSDLRDTGRMLELFGRFKTDKDLVDPIPPVIAQVLDERRRNVEARKATTTVPIDVENSTVAFENPVVTVTSSKV